TVAFHLCVENTGAQSVAVTASASGLAGPGAARLAADGVRLFRDWYVRDREWYPEVAVPLSSGGFSIPDPRNPIPGQRNQSVLVEIAIPHAARPGRYRGRLSLGAAGSETFAVPVALTVWNLDLPDGLSFNVDLNAYAPPGDAAREIRFHRMAHEHRATLN